MYGLHTAPACTLCLYTVHASEHNVQSVRILCRFSEADGRDEGKERETSWQTERDAGSLCYPSVCLAAVWLMRQFLTLSGHSLITCSQTHTSIFIAGLCISTITHTHWKGWALIENTQCLFMYWSLFKNKSHVLKKFIVGPRTCGPYFSFPRSNPSFWKIWG